MKITMLMILLMFTPGITLAGEGHDAGYNWASKHDIIHPDECGGNSQSFVEGCQEYAEERQREICTENPNSSDCEQH